MSVCHNRRRYLKNRIFITSALQFVLVELRELAEYLPLLLCGKSRSAVRHRQAKDSHRILSELYCRDQLYHVSNAQEAFNRLPDL